MENMKDVVVRFSRRGESGNIFAVIGSMYHQLRERGMTMEEFQPYFREITTGHNYEEALATLRLIKDKHLEGDYVYWEHLAAIQAALGNRSEALKAYKKVLRLRPNHAAAREFLRKKK